MHLNPLKKDDNTDALVKALEDANSSSQTSTASQTVDANLIASDPQVSAQNNPLLTNIPENSDDPASSVMEVPAPPSIGLENTLPAHDTPNTKLSSDANAHLATVDAGSTDLDSVKRQALEQLRPLIEKIDLSPSDKFDKYLMMLRASDDPALIKPAYDSAVQIHSEKEKAQALLDIINEINYITSSKQ